MGEVAKSEDASKVAEKDKRLEALALDIEKQILNLKGDSSPKRVVIIADNLKQLAKYGSQIDYVAKKLDSSLSQPISILVREAYVRQEGDYSIEFEPAMRDFSILPSPATF